MPYKSCYYIENGLFSIGQIMDNGEIFIKLCCESIPGRPGVTVSGTAGDMLNTLAGKMRLFQLECEQNPPDEDRHYSKGCLQCNHFIFDNWAGCQNKLVEFIDLSVYPSPCSAKCIYCGVKTGEEHFAKELKSDNVKAAYDKVFDMLDLALKRGIISNNAQWNVASGEITVHPYRDRIMGLVSGKRAVFCTNCIKFDKDIAKNLSENPNAGIFTSLDAGTRETWKKVKGIDNFDRVVENIKAYHRSQIKPGQIIFKYIILPGVNDNYEDYIGIIKLMKECEIPILRISQDYTYKNTPDPARSAAAAELSAQCFKNNIIPSLFDYLPGESQEIIKKTKEICRGAGVDVSVDQASQQERFNGLLHNRGYKKVGFWPASDGTARILEQYSRLFENSPFEIALFDSNSQYHGTERFGYPVYSKQDAIDKGFDCILITSYQHGDVILEQIKDLRVQGVDVKTFYKPGDLDWYWLSEWK